MSTIRAMIDIETFGRPPRAVILEVGVVRNDGADPLEVVIDAARQPLRRCDVSTIMWWQSHPDALAAVMRRQQHGISLRDGMALVARALRGCDEIWANSPSYDLAIIADAMNQCQITPPWAYWQERDFRTVRAVHPGVDYIGTVEDAHSAIADAAAQAAYLNTLGLWTDHN